MTPIPQRISASGVSQELLDSIGHLEGRIAANELALRVVRAAMALRDVAGARLWKLEPEGGEVWAEIGTLPERAKSEISTCSSNDIPKNVWTGALGSDDFRMRVLEAHAEKELTEDTKSQLGLLARFAALALAL